MTTDKYLSRVKASCESELFARDGVTAVGVGRKIKDGQRTGDMCIRIYVAKKLPKTKLSKAQLIPASIDGVPTDVIERRFVANPQPDALKQRMKVDEISARIDTGTYGTLKGGMSIGPCRVIDGYVYVGTLGCIVKDNATGESMLLSNKHVMCVDDSWTVGDDICQPARNDQGSCPADVVGSVVRSIMSADVDGALASIAGRPSACDVLQIGPVRGTALHVFDEPVRKRGRTTELTHGFVDDMDWSGNVDMGPLGIRFFANQIGLMHDPSKSPQFGISGDSGSVVVNPNDEVIGLYFAGDDSGEFGLANPIAKVESELGVTVCVEPSFVATTPTDDLPQTFPGFEDGDITFAWRDQGTTPTPDDLRTSPGADYGGGFSWNKRFDDVKAAGYDTIWEHLLYDLPRYLGIEPWMRRDGGAPNHPEGGGQAQGRSPFALATPHHAPNAPEMSARMGPGPGAGKGAASTGLGDGRAATLAEVAEVLAQCQAALASISRSEGADR